MTMTETAELKAPQPRHPGALSEGSNIGPLDDSNGAHAPLLSAEPSRNDLPF
jgi:hypothetical protein